MAGKDSFYFKILIVLLDNKCVKIVLPINISRIFYSPTKRDFLKVTLNPRLGKDDQNKDLASNKMSYSTASVSSRKSISK